MNSLKKILQEISQKLDGSLIINIIGMDGISIAEYNTNETNSDAFSAKFAVIMSMIERWTGELDEWGEFEEDLIVVKTSKVWIIALLLDSNYFLGFMINRQKGVLRNIQLIIKKYRTLIKKELYKTTEFPVKI
ncbi:roadblock/LC7 domain-containing protein [Desulfobacula phenolica]|uniref:Predicted regulator of Ras-like GTPase activity, Roadblock/LC7/MglB family n=1 Tax=Desulfobacula phenolica TaxID=90732 RepID=A0A1H2K0F0_9BACT|nr:hypothetical protein [Desulfobacula phenolica]SDU61866.1 Predicted regulator of Ras-like GTPase activity, Roadblock/LC7/MglB family [Desulfobacula phenolica]